jgi:hypothetical protein
MDTSRDSSLLRSLAVAFGDGLAFGVGMKITQKAARPAGAGSGSDLAPLAGKLDEIEERLKRIERAPAVPAESMDQKIIDSLVNALEARLQEQGAQVDRRLADLETRVAMEMRTLDQQDRSQTRNLEEGIAALRNEVVTLHREFAGQLARIVAEQLDARVAVVVESAVEKRVAAAVDLAVEKRLAPAAERAVEKALERRQTAAEDQVTPLREELARKDQEIAALERRVQEAESATLEFILSMGQMCRETAERMSRPTLAASPDPGPVQPQAPPQAAPPPEAAPTPAPAPIRPASAQASVPPPSFLQPKRPGGLWRMPLVSSLLVSVTAAALLLFK